jgi:SAM-dependent methyltransferase
MLGAWVLLQRVNGLARSTTYLYEQETADYHTTMEQIDKERIDNIYRDVPLEEIPWNVETPPQALVDLVESGRISPCKTIDLGCGAGNYAIYLATRGFDVTGVDASPTAVHIAEHNAQQKGVTCTFLVADILGDLHEVTDTFDFAYDWEVLHHIFPEQRKRYVENVHRLLNPRGKYLSVCFSEDDPQFGGAGKYRETPLGTVLYFSSEGELRDLFAPLFTILELRTIEVHAKFAPHRANYAFMERT